MNARAIVIGVAAALGVLVVMRGNVSPFASIGDYIPDAIGDAVSEAAATIEDVTGMGPKAQELFSISREPNVAAFRAMIIYSEGTARDGDPYATLYAYRTFDSFADHPRIKVTAGAYTSTAAGAYQIMEATWDSYRARWGIPDFSPDSQDAFCVGLIRLRGALDDVRAGRFNDAVRKCGKEWASLPGSPYGQPVRTLDQVQAAYINAGGMLA